MQTVHMVSSYRNCFEDGWLVLNHISQFNISIYETSKHFPEFIAAVESSQWATFYKKGKSQLRKAALILVLWSFCLAIHRDMKSKEPSIPKLRNDRFSTEYMARTHDLVFCFLMSNHKKLPLNEDRVFCVQDKIFKREVIKDCLRKLEEWQVLYWTRGYCIPAIDEPKVQIGYWAINLSAFMPFYERNAPVIDQIIESISVPQTNKFLSAPRVLLRELSITDAIGSDGKMETVQKWKDVDRKKTPNYQDIQPVKTTEPYLKRYTENLRDIKISFGCFEDLSPEVQQSVLEEWQQRTEEIKRKHKKKIRAGRTTIKRSLRERYQEYRESLYTLNSPNFAKKYNEELRRLERCFLRSSFPSPHAVFHHVGKLWLMGCIYNNIGIDGIKREFTPCLKINGEYVAQIDVVSSNIQFYVLRKGKADPHQDFYVYPILGDYGFNRNQIKSLIVSMLNAEFITAIRAYNDLHTGVSSINGEELRLILKVIKTTRPYLKMLLNDSNEAKKSITEESKFMVDVGKELLARQIPYIHHFDALYVPKSKREETISIMESVSRQMFEGRVIALRWSDDERVDVDNVKIKTYKDYPDVMEKIPKMTKTFKKKWDQIQNQRAKAKERKKVRQKEESQE